MILLPRLAFLQGREQREATGVRGGGTQCVVTDLGLLEPDETGELVLTGLHDCCDADQVKANTGWDLKVAATLRHTEPPSEKELKILREELDPQGTYR